MEPVLPGRAREHAVHREHHNQDLGIEHNFSIYDCFFEKTNYFTAPKITGVSSETVQVEGLPPGQYYFQCDVHGPAMSGAFIVPHDRGDQRWR